MESGFYGFETLKQNIMKQIENTLQDLKCMLIEDGYTEANIVMRTLIKAQEQVKNCSIPDVSQQRELLIADFIEKYNRGLVGNERIHEDCLKDYFQGNL